MPKSPDAFRTISEVADWLGIQAHVLRFWESKFTQVKPIKRAGGRRYYRPGDMLLLGGIRQLLHEDGLTIKGVQKILREEGMSHVASLSQPLDELTQSQIDNGADASMSVADPEPEETGVVLNFEPAQAKEPQGEVIDMVPVPEAPMAEDVPTEPAVEAVQESIVEKLDVIVEKLDVDAATPATGETAPDDAVEEPPAATLPAFLRRPMAEPAAPTDNPPSEPGAPEPEAAEPQVAEPETAVLKPRVIDMPVITPVDQIAASPALLSAAFRTRSLTKAQAADLAPLLDRLTSLRDSMAARRGTPGQTAPDA
jgi:DNA-binding transcriptional MerR regulator